MMKRFILTGAPGSGKTSVLHQLELEGFSVVEEAATDVVAIEQAHGIHEPWKEPSFINKIVTLQKRRLIDSSSLEGKIHFNDRSIFCTAALAAYLGYAISKPLDEELDRVKSANIFERNVFFIRNIGFITPTDARRISFEESLRFEQIHEEIYRKFSFELIFIAPGTVRDRVTAIKNALNS